jgi:YbbR domain-containing protein
LNSNKVILTIIENWPVKVLSIAIAIILFVFNRLNTLTSRPLSVPLLIETSAELVPASAYPQKVRINLRGEDEGIKSISESDVEAYVDLSQYENGGLYSVPVLVRKKGSALGIEPLEITVSPSKIAVQLDQRISRTIPLTAAVRGRAADGFDMVSYTLSPQEVAIVGPRVFLESIIELETDTIELDGRYTDFTAVVNIINPSSLFTLRGNETAEFSCVIRPSVSVRSIEDIPIVLTSLNWAFEADTGGRTGSIRIEGMQSALDSFMPPPDFFTVDCAAISEPGMYTLPVAVVLSREFTLIRREPEELVLTISAKEDNF